MEFLRRINQWLQDRHDKKHDRRWAEEMRMVAALTAADYAINDLFDSERGFTTGRIHPSQVQERAERFGFPITETDAETVLAFRLKARGFSADRFMNTQKMEAAK